MTPALDTSFAALPPQPPIDTHREQRLVARFNARYPSSPNRVSTTDVWNIDCRCGGSFDVFVRHDEFRPPEPPRRCERCQHENDRDCPYPPARRPPIVDVKGALEQTRKTKDRYYQALMAARYAEAADDVAYAKADFMDAVDVLRLRAIEAGGERMQAAYASHLSSRAVRHAIDAAARAFRQ
jgi:hypothetical protein